MIATAMLLTATGMSAWAQAPAADDPHHPPLAASPAPAQQTPQAMPMTNCPGNSGAMAGSQKGCPMATGDVKSEQGGMSVEEMKHGMMHGQMRHGGSHSDHGNCCELSKADKPK
ncbi:MAG: hypothetical protein HY244_07515 [Rhizobiales bacterium]|nr:hypothetical protein [Hyphomicrobiales bacterium]